MPSWLLSLPEFVREDVRSGEAIAVLIATLLIALLWLILPGKHKRLVRQPVIFLVIHLVAHIARKSLFTGDSNVAHVLIVIAVLSILASIGRSTVSLVLDVYFFVALASLRAAGIEPSSILTTSALLTAVIGLSLQETLGNLFAGLALQMQQPFEIGDWIQFDNEPKNVG